VQTAGASIIQILHEKQGKRLAELQNLQAQLANGEVGAGRTLFFGKALCSTCHAVIGQGGDFGPDLTNIGEIRSQHDILEAILYPSASFAREYESSKVVTNNTAYNGIIKQQLPETIMIETGPGIIVRISRNDVKTIEQQSISLMPPGLDKQLTLQEMSDLMAYLSSLPDGLGHLKQHDSE
jgi:putative heme-binding domain-containing protein